MQSCDRRPMDPNRTAHHLGFPGPSPVCAYIAGPCSLRSTFTLFFLGSGLDGAYSSQSMKGASPRPLWIQGLCTTCQVQSCPHAVTRASCGQPNPFSPGPHGEDARWAWGSKPCESKTVCGHLLRMYTAACLQDVTRQAPVFQASPVTNSEWQLWAFLDSLPVQVYQDSIHTCLHRLFPLKSTEMLLKLQPNPSQLHS